MNDFTTLYPELDPDPDPILCRRPTPQLLDFHTPWQTTLFHVSLKRQGLDAPMTLLPTQPPARPEFPLLTHSDPHSSKDPCHGQLL